MSLWTPYSAEDAPLDLTRSVRSAQVKCERLSPLEACSADCPYPTYDHCVASYCRSPHCLPPYHSPAYSDAPAVPAASVSSDESGATLFPARVSPASCVSAASSVSPSPRSAKDRKSLPRPFKTVTSLIESDRSDPKYGAFRESMMATLLERNGGSLCVSNPRMRRAVRRSGTAQDPEYSERRARNNAAAKKSRDLRRLKEDELAIRTAYLESENRALRTEVASLRRQLDSARPAASLWPAE